jgi:tRNA-2-methylthio-N6-dimethylallyladenosine synthase
MVKKNPPKSFYIRTYGCQMNELDSDLMAGALIERGLVKKETEEEADLLLFNTCSVRDLAERKVMGKIGRMGRRSFSNKIIGVTGCMANNKKESLFAKLPQIDFMIGTNNIHDLNPVLDEFLTTGEQQIRTDGTFTHELDYSVVDRSDPLKAYVTIIRGCDKYCTYCIVPYTRGPEVSREPQSIVDECRELVAKGTKEITLLGQNVNSYGKDRPDWGVLFHDLLYQLDKIPGLERVRFMTSHPCDISPDLMMAVRDLPSLCELVHFPIQAGSNRILKKMHRMYTKEEYFEKVAKLRSLVPDVSLGTDIIVGFPTETEEEFEETYRAMEEIGFSVAFIYAYSPRKGTPATRWADDVPESEKQRRLQKLMALQENFYLRDRENLIGQVVEVLVEKRNQKESQYLKGLTRCWKNALFPGGDELIGTLQKVKIHSISHHTLIGDRV